jgi:glycosyltransferase involved in cell wall biosynthesis
MPIHPAIRTFGFLDKRKKCNDFVELIQTCHFGCLFSTEEAFGISNREFLRCGVPVLASNVGGIPDTLPTGLGFLYDLQQGPEPVADTIQNFIENDTEYDILRKEVCRRAHEVSWDYVARNLISIWQGSQDHSYESVVRPFLGKASTSEKSNATGRQAQNG